MDEAGLAELVEAIRGAAGADVLPAGRPRWLGAGGGVNETGRLTVGDRCLFVKLNRSDRLEMFRAEAAALEALDRCDGLRVPAVVAVGHGAGRAFLVLEHIELRSLDGRSGQALGQGLASLHRLTGERHGWWRDNTIGTTHQDNTPDSDWRAFWRERRLRPQLALAARNGAGGRLADLGERLIAALPDILDGHDPMPSLLHGDLWSGNAAADPAGRPVVFDPASYHGDRETDLAMAELFGGFPEAFHRAYREVWPLDPGYRLRRGLYQLYHVLNHYNLFGGGYLARSLDLIRGLLSEVGA